MIAIRTMRLAVFLVACTDVFWERNNFIVMEGEKADICHWWRRLLLVTFYCVGKPTIHDLLTGAKSEVGVGSQEFD